MIPDDKLIQMGIIRSPNDQDLVSRGDKVVNDKGKQRDESPVKKEQSKEPLGSKRSKNNDKGKVFYSYCGKGFHSESSYMRRQLDEMDLLFKRHNISIPTSARKVDHEEETKECEETCHALKASCSTTHAFLIDYGASNHMVASRESFSSLQCFYGPSIQMGNSSKF